METDALYVALVPVSGKNLEAILDAAPDAIVISDMGGNILLANGQAQRMFGYAPAELARKKITLLIPGYVYPGQASHQQPFLRKPTVRQTEKGLETHGCRKDGSKFPISVSLAPLETKRGFLTWKVIRDITDRKKVEQEAGRLSRMLADAEKATGRGSWEWDVRTGERTWSKGMYGILGVNEGSFDKSTGQFLALIHAEDRDRVSKAIAKAVKAPGPFYEEYRVVRPDGETRHFRHEADIIRDALGKAHVLHGVMEDITERGELARAEALRLETINALRARVLDMITHELNSPLTPLKIHLHLLSTALAHGLTGKQRDSVAIASAMTERIVGFLGDVLDLVRVQSGTLSINPKSYDICAQARRVVADMDVGPSGLNARVVVTEPTEAIVLADPRRIEQVLVNLLSNALKFSDPGGRVELGVAWSGDGVQVNVHGGGRGLRPEDIPKLFQPFVQVGGKDQQRHSGTGLGLYICRSIIEQHGGRIWCESPGLGQGATFSFTLPSVPAPPSMASTSTPSAVVPGAR